jgi:hypothetical protein
VSDHSDDMEMHADTDDMLLYGEIRALEEKPLSEVVQEIRELHADQDVQLHSADKVLDICAKFDKGWVLTKKQKACIIHACAVTRLFIV